MTKLPTKAIALTGAMTLGALAALAWAIQAYLQPALQLTLPVTTQPALHLTGLPLASTRGAVLLLAALLTARLKVKLPGLTGNMSVNLPFVLVSLAQLSLLEALLVAVPSCAVQCLPKRNPRSKTLSHLKPAQVVFNLSTTAVAAFLASLCAMRYSLPLGTFVFFLAQTLPVAAIIRLTEGGLFKQIWLAIARCSFPFYVLSAGLTSIAMSGATSRTEQIVWQMVLVGLPVLYAVYRSYESYFREGAAA